MGPIVLLVLPLAVLSLGLMLFSLRDLYRRPNEGVRGGNRWVWGAVILTGTLGSILYLVVGRLEAPVRDE